MMGLIDETKGDEARFSVGHFDLDDHRRGSPLGLPEVRRDLQILRFAAGRADRNPTRADRQEHLQPLRA